MVKGTIINESGKLRQCKIVISIISSTQSVCVCVEIEWQKKCNQLEMGLFINDSMEIDLFNQVDHLERMALINAQIFHQIMIGQ